MVLAIALWAVAPVLARERSAPQTPEFAARLELVHLVVNVEDRDGRPVPDLRAEDFVVREDGLPQSVSVCLRAADGEQSSRLDVDLALLLDVSGSMIENVQLSRVAAMTFLDAVPRARDTLVVLFHHEIRGFRYRPEDREATLRLIEGTEAGGGTALYDAIHGALTHLRTDSGREVIVLVSDGENLRSRIAVDDLFEEIRGSRATIYPILFSGPLLAKTSRRIAAETFLERIARMSGGEVFLPEGPKGIGEAFDRLLKELSSQYVLGFAPSNDRHDGAYRKLKVEVKRPKTKVRHREGYVAPKGEAPPPRVRPNGQ